MRRQRICCGSCRLGWRRACRFITTRTPSGIWACTRRGKTSSTSFRIMRGCMGRFAAVGAGYFAGRAKQDDYLKETAVLSAEAMVDAGILDQAMKYALDREYPLAHNARGGFWPGGPKSWPNNPSMPSEHAMNVWAFAHVVAGQYDGIATKSLVYGVATTVSVSRVLARRALPFGCGGGEHVRMADWRVRAASSLAGARESTGCIDGGDAAGEWRSGAGEFVARAVTGVPLRRRTGRDCWGWRSGSGIRRTCSCASGGSCRRRG